MILLNYSLATLKSSLIKNDRQFNLLIIISFLGLGLLGILNHAMWRDELNGWLIARDSESFGQFLYNIRYEGHPILWYLCLLLLNQVTHNPIIMQLFHLAIATSCTILFVLFSPFTKLQKILFTFSYLPFYEYALISRNYSLGILAIFAFCTVYKTRQKNYLFLALLLALMANTNAYCLLIALALFLTLAFEYLWQNQLNFKTQATLQNILISLAIFGLGIILSVVMLMPPADSTLQGGASQWFLQFDWYRLAQATTRIWNSYILILVPSDSKLTDVIIFAILSLGIFTFFVTTFITKPVALFFYVFGSLEILVFTYLKFLGSQRHYGHLFIILIVSLWLASYYSELHSRDLTFKKLPQKTKKILLKWQSFVKRQKTTFIIMILSAQLIAGIVSYSRDLLTPYSASRATADFIKKENLDRLPIVGSEDFAVSPISSYLNQKIYYPESQHLGSYVLFNAGRKEVSSNEILAQTLSVLNTSQAPEAILILNRQLDTKEKTLDIRLIKEFKKAFIHNEKYYLYLVQKS